MKWGHTHGADMLRRVKIPEERPYEDTVFKPRNPGTSSAEVTTLDTQHLRLGENKLLLVKPPTLSGFSMATLAY